MLLWELNEKIVIATIYSASVTHYKVYQEFHIIRSFILHDSIWEGLKVLRMGREDRWGVLQAEGGAKVRERQGWRGAKEV